MNDKALFAVALTLMVIGGLFVYGINDQMRAQNGTGRVRTDSVETGTQLFAQYCSPCHGPKGEGCVGPALDRPEWKGDNKENDMKAVTDLVTKTITRGRASNQPGISMPAWFLDEGGPLNSQQIDDLVAFIEYGDWNQTLQYVNSANLAIQPKDLPNPVKPGQDPNNKDAQRQFSDQEMSQVTTLLVSKGCLNCHAIGSGVGGNVAISLNDVGSRRENLDRGITAEDWIRRWVSNPKAMPSDLRGRNLFVNPKDFKTEKEYQAALLPYNTAYMPAIPLTQDELNLVARYLSSLRIEQK